jgi:hypothetical protein
MEHLQIPAGEFSRRSSYLKDKKRGRQADHQMDEKQKRHQQAEQARKTHQEEALREAEGLPMSQEAFDELEQLLIAKF